MTNYDFNLMEHEQEYECYAYLCKNYSGIIDSLKTSDTDEMENFIQENAMKGLFVEVIKYEPDCTSSIRVNPDNYANEIERYGDYYYEFK